MGLTGRSAALPEQENTFLADALYALYLCLLGIYACLAWVFQSWTRPLVVMAIIPFGLIGTIWGHYLWDIPLSMFTVVGLIGMTGIIINDSIVLVTTISDYARNRGLVPAVIDATADRLRPVLLTTLTTVFGIAPLLYETSRQAQFLKPTVVTLAYGLGAGMLLVLIVVPSLVIIQQDVGRLFRGLRRGLFGRHQLGVLRGILTLSTLAAIALVAGTFGVLELGGALLAPVEAIRSLFDMTERGAALSVLVTGLLAIYILGMMASVSLRRGATPNSAPREGHGS